MYCVGSISPYYQCQQNSFLQLDTEFNTAGDYMFGQSAIFNSIVHANSFSNPGVTFKNGAHGNTIIGGAIGAGSSADGSTWANRIIGVNTTTLSGVTWTDAGQNHADTIYNNFSANYIDEVNNYNRTNTIRYSAASRSICLNTPTPGFEATILSGCSSSNFLGLDTTDGFTAGWLIYNVGGGGMNFMSETSPGVNAIPDGSIVNHRWGFGRYNQTPAYPFHFFDTVATTVGVQAGAGQGPADLVTFSNNGGTRMSGVTYQGKWDGPIVGGSIGQALCKKADSTIGYCSTVVSGSGACTCN